MVLSGTFGPDPASNSLKGGNKHAKESTAATTLETILRKWDRANKVQRQKIMASFVARNAHKSGPQLEREYGNGASLFLTRVSAWLRITYLVGYAVAEALQVISIFVEASSGHRFLTEFIEVGGLVTVMDILSVPTLAPDVKLQACRLLQQVANQGRGCKELMCELNGADVALHFFLSCDFEDEGEGGHYLPLHAQQLIVTLGRGNPNYADLVMQSALGGLGAPQPGAQVLCAQAVRILLTLNHPPGSYFPLVYHAAEAVSGMMGSGDAAVQHEAAECLKALRRYQGGDLHIVASLCSGMAVAVADPPQPPAAAPAVAAPLPTVGEEPGEGGEAAAAAVLAQQARSMADDSPSLHQQLTGPGMIKVVLACMGNTDHFPSQQAAQQLLVTLVSLDCDHVVGVLGELMGERGRDFTRLVLSNPQSLLDRLTALDLATLKSIAADVAASRRPLSRDLDFDFQSLRPAGGAGPGAEEEEEGAGGGGAFLTGLSGSEGEGEEREGLEGRASRTPPALA